MDSTIVVIGEARIKTTVTNKDSEIKPIIEAFLSNGRNRKKIIGLETERVPVEGMQLPGTALLQLCDGDNCLIVTFPFKRYENIPISLFNFLNSTDFTFVGIGINKTLMKLETDIGLTCKNAVEIGPSMWNLNYNVNSLARELIHKFMKIEKPTSPVFDYWRCNGEPGFLPFSTSLNENQIKYATANAYSAFAVGSVLLLS